MSLSETLEQANKVNREKIPNEILEIMDSSTQELISMHLAEKTIKVGSSFPSVTLPNAKGNDVNIQDYINKGPLVISFYRGGWCPYCNLELNALQKALPDFKKLGANLVAISPETPDNSLTTSEKNNLSFQVLTDNNNTLAKELGLVFKLSEDIKSIYDNFGLDISKHNGNEDFELPMPATFVVDVNGKIVYRFVNEDYTKRAEIEDILDALNKLK